MRGVYDGFALPSPTPPTFSLLIDITNASCYGTGWRQAGVLLAMEGLEVQLDCRSSEYLQRCLARYNWAQYCMPGCRF